MYLNICGIHNINSLTEILYLPNKQNKNVHYVGNAIKTILIKYLIKNVSFCKSYMPVVDSRVESIIPKW